MSHVDNYIQTLFNVTTWINDTDS
jgi:hypothetical protein